MTEKRDDTTWLLAVGALALGSAATVAYFLKRMSNTKDLPIVNPYDLILDMPLNAGREPEMLAVDGAVNFRDLGGYLTVDGRQRVKRGELYRSGALNGLTHHGAEILAEMGIQLVCDLRTDDEIRKKPDQIPADTGIRYVHNPIAQDNPMRILSAMLFQRRQLGRIFADAYKYELLAKGAEYIGDAIRTLADPANRPVVLHCTAGKDRAGILAALLLAILDIPEDVILADYSQSNRYYRTFAQIAQEDIHRVRHLGIRKEHVHPVVLADPAVMKEALEFLRNEYGSLRAYLLGPAGLTENTLHSLRSQLLEPA